MARTATYLKYSVLYMCFNYLVGDTRCQSNHYHCVKSVCIRSYSGSHFPAFGLNTEKYSVSSHSVQIQEYTDQNIFEYGHFLRSVLGRMKVLRIR